MPEWQKHLNGSHRIQASPSHSGVHHTLLQMRSVLGSIISTSTFPLGKTSLDPDLSLARLLMLTPIWQVVAWGCYSTFRGKRKFNGTTVSQRHKLNKDLSLRQGATRTHSAATPMTGRQPPQDRIFNWFHNSGLQSSSDQ